MKKKKSNDLNTYLIIALVIVMAIGLYFTLSVPKIEEPAPEVVPPPREITLTLLGNDCDDCTDLSRAVDALKQQEGMNVTEVTELSIEESKELAEKYEITRLPALLILGNTSGLTLPNFNTKEDALVFDQVPPPYYDVAEEKLKGDVTVVLLMDQTCTDCFNLSQVIQQLSDAGLKIVSQSVVDSNDVEGKGLIEQYSIEILPTLIFSNDALEYDVVQQVWDQVGSVENDSKLVLRQVSPPYINVSTGKTEGLVKISYLVDETCEDCYNVSVLKDLFAQGFNMAFDKEEVLDISKTKGKFLVKKYNLSIIPTIILSKEANIYPGIAEAWAQVGTQELDGSFVFRKVELLKDYFKQSQNTELVYKDLNAEESIETAEVVEVSSDSNESAEPATTEEEQ